MSAISMKTNSLPSLAGLGREIAAQGGNFEMSKFAQYFPQELIIRQEEHLGVIRALEPPQDFIGLGLVPMMEVDDDDVVFDIVNGGGGIMAPARSSDAEAKLWASTEFYSGRGEASTIDWALKNHYTASDIQTYRDFLSMVEETEETGKFKLYGDKLTKGFQGKVARDTKGRKSALDRRIEWLITQGLFAAKIEYTDDDLPWVVNFGRPADQHQQAPKSGSYATDQHDPLGDFFDVKEKISKKWHIDIDRAVCSTKFLNTLWKSKYFRLLAGFAPGTTIAPEEVNYLLPGFGPQTAIDIIKRETGIQFIISDNVRRVVDPAGPGNTFLSVRYTPEDEVLFLPNESQLAEYDDTSIGFGKVLTSPHPANGFNPGWYSWEKDHGVDPWGYTIGSGIKAFPVLPHMYLTYSWKVQLPA